MSWNRDSPATGASADAVEADAAAMAGSVSIRAAAIINPQDMAGSFGGDSTECRLP